jgi:hypothetical protein
MADIQHTWPNLVGKDGNEAVEVIKRESGIIIESHFLFENFFFILLRFNERPHCATKFNGHHGLSYRSG